MSTYSFRDIVGAISGPGGNLSIAAEAGVASEGITITPVGDKSSMVMGADGFGVHNLVSGDPMTATVRIMKTSPLNALLMAMYNFQTRSSLFHGKNNITFRDISRGDFVSLTRAAFKKVPDINFAAEAGIVEWVFESINSTIILGIGTPEF